MLPQTEPDASQLPPRLFDRCASWFQPVVWFGFLCGRRLTRFVVPDGAPSLARVHRRPRFCVRETRFRVLFTRFRVLMGDRRCFDG